MSSISHRPQSGQVENAKATHAPGPWQEVPRIPHANHVAHAINDSHGQPVASVSGSALHHPLGVPEANARLIAAAPDLLDACRTMLEQLQAEELTSCDHEAGICNCGLRITAKQAEAAIARAEWGAA